MTGLGSAAEHSSRDVSSGVAHRRSYSTVEIAEVAAGLQRILDAIARGELSAEPGEINRLEGAIAALEALVGSAS